MDCKDAKMFLPLSSLIPEGCRQASVLNHLPLTELREPPKIRVFNDKSPFVEPVGHPLGISRPFQRYDLRVTVLRFGVQNVLTKK